MPASDPEDVRQAALKRQSDDHLAFAVEGGPSAAGSAFEAGYCALLSTLTANETAAFYDHPSATAVVLSAGRLQLSAVDRALAELGATDYYAADQGAFGSVEKWLAWAARLRAARGWSQ